MLTDTCNPRLSKAGKYMDFPWYSLKQFLLVGPFKNSNTATTPNTDTFVSNTFGNVTFTSVRVEEVSQLRVVEAGAFAGSERTLKEITFRWNSGLTDFPFAEVGCNALSLLYLIQYYFLIYHSDKHFLLPWSWNNYSVSFIVIRLQSSHCDVVCNSMTCNLVPHHGRGSSGSFIVMLQ